MAKQQLNNKHSSSSDSSAVAITPVLSSDELVGLPIEELFERMDTSPQGLTSNQAAERLEVYGRNELAGESKHSIVKDFLLHFKSPLVLILLFAAVISGVLNEIVNMVIILIIVFASIALDSYQESKASKAAELLKQKVTTTATVIREGVRQEIGLPEIVPGDVIYLSAGDILPADARVISAKDLFVNQSALTGESFPVEKIAI